MGDLLERTRHLAQRFYDRYGRWPTDLYVPRVLAERDQTFMHLYWEARESQRQWSVLTLWDATLHIGMEYDTLMALHVGNRDWTLVDHGAPLARPPALPPDAPERGIRLSAKGGA